VSHSEEETVVSEDILTIATLETRHAQVWQCLVDGVGEPKLELLEEWDPSKYLTDDDGIRLVEELIRRIRLAWKKSTKVSDGIVLTLPGTISRNQEIVSSSRLGIHKPLNICQFISGELAIPCRVFHDLECVAIGHTNPVGEGRSHSETENETLVYVFVDEGVGSKIIIGGKTHTGAGVAGTLGRLTVQPDGAYFKQLAARGTLEVFSSRPWVSHNLVAMYLSEVDKAMNPPAEIIDSPFRRALGIAASGDWEGIDYQQIADGVNANDPIASSVLDVAARYLGFALNSIITILHPHSIILGGAMMTEVPNFASQSINYARQLSWPLAWNQTNIVVSSMGRESQIVGALNLWSMHKATNESDGISKGAV
jgi:glucokinase